MTPQVGASAANTMNSPRRLAHVRACRHDVDDAVADGGKQRRRREAEAETPDHHQPHGAAERAAVARAVGLAAQLFGRGRDAVEEEGADQREIMQHRIGGEDHVAGARPARGEEHEGRDQRRGADHDVAIDRQHAHQPGAVEQGRRRDAEAAAEDAPGDGQPGGETGDFRDHRGQGGAALAGVQPQHQDDHADHVDQVEADLNGHGGAHARQPDQPAQHHVIAEREGRRPDAHQEIAARGGGHFRAAAHGVEDEGGGRRLQRHDDEADTGGDQQRAQEHGALLERVARAQRLRGEGDRAHAQEGEQPEQAVEGDRRHGDAAQQRRVSQPADGGGRHHAEQRRRHIGQHRRPGDGENPGVGNRNRGQVICRAAR